MSHPSIRAWFLAIAATATACLPATAQSTGKPNKPQQGNAPTLIILHDCSESMGAFKGSTQAVVHHLIQLADLSGSRTKIAVVFFSGDVRVVGENGMPTAAYRTLQCELVKTWPKPQGATSMDEAFGEVVRMVSTLPGGSEVTVLLFTDGEPDSGRLRPEAFPEIKADIDRRLQAVREKYKDFEPEIVQRQLSKVENELKMPGTEKWMTLYKRQIQAEFQKTLAHAAVLKKAGVRLVAMDYDGRFPKLRQIHEAAGGKADDFVLVRPASSVLDKVHTRGLTALPNVLVQAPARFDLDPTVFERTYKLKLDPVGDRAVVTLVFEPGIADFEKHVALEARVGTTTYTFSPSNDDQACTLGFDNAGRVVTAHLTLDQLPADDVVTISYRSPARSLAAPACTAYVHLRVAADLKPEFRPAHAKADAGGPFTLSPNHPVQWAAALRSRSKAQAYPIKGIEAVLRPRQQTGAELRITTQSDPQSPHVFVSDAATVARGTYDVELHIQLDSGLQLNLKLPGHVQSQDVNEFLTLEVAQLGEHRSQRRGHADFGEVGDEHAGGTVEVYVRSHGSEYPLTVEAAVEALADSRGTAPRKPWIAVTPHRFTLQPGRPQRLLLSLKLPEQVEDEIVDGPFQAVLGFSAVDQGGQTLPVKRFQQVTGVPEDEAVSQLTFSLRRPRLQASASHCFHNTLQVRGGQTVLPVQVSLAVPFRRTVTLTVTHNSVLPRQVTAFASTIFRDRQGKQLHTVRLVLNPDCEAGQELAPGGSGTWTCTLEVDAGHDVREALGEIALSAPGMPPVRVTVTVMMRQPLLGPVIRKALVVAAVLVSLLAVVALVRRLRLRGFTEGRAVRLTPERAVAGIRLHEGRDGTVTLVSEEPIWYSSLPAGPKQRLAEGRPLTLSAQQRQSGVVLGEQADGEDKGWMLELTEFLDEPPEAHGEILAAPVQTTQAERLRRQWRRRLLLAVVFGLLALTLFTPLVLGLAQWCIDLFTL